MVSEPLTPKRAKCRRKVPMRCSMSSALICAALLAAGGGLNAAQAADVQTGIYPPYQPAGMVTEFTSGWYLRGDIGWRTNTKIGEIDYNGTPWPTGVSFKDIATVGGGGGYKWQWLRLDATFDYSGRTRFYTTAQPNGAYDAKVDTLVGLANLYIDLGTWSGVTPYIGAGVGFVNFWTHDYTAPNGPVSTDSHSKADLAWAVMAGFAWCFAPRWSLDFNYRRLNFGEMSFNPHLPNALTLRDMTANEFRIGLRYNLD
jgi:opacity protein-like surface antigen